VSGISDADLAREYGEAEVAVVPSLYEGFSLPAVEAMACGVPVVATTGGALPEVVGRDGETGLLVRPDDPGALAAAIGRLLDDPGLRARLGGAGRHRVLHRFTWQVTAKGTAECYSAVMEGRPLPGARHRARGPVPAAPAALAGSAAPLTGPASAASLGAAGRPATGERGGAGPC
jgi:glycogen synthase